MKALIIGGAGFVGGHLMNSLLSEAGYSVAATKMSFEKIERNDVGIFDLDILDYDAVLALLGSMKPDVIFHLAAQSSVALSWKKPALTVDVNIKGTVHVLEAIRELDLHPRILLIGSGEEYGKVEPYEVPVSETNKVRPGNIYAATKACQNMIGAIYAKAYQMEIVMVRAFNHIGPNQAPMFVVSDFCSQAARIEKGEQSPVIRVGNLSAKRDFTDVRDVVKAYLLLSKIGQAGELYNVGSGEAVAIEEILNKILSLAKCPIEIELDNDKMRPSDVPIIMADISKIEGLGWKREIPLDQSLLDTLEYWRNI